MTVTNHFLHSFGEAITPESQHLNIVRAEGSTIWDDTGKAYIDGMASLWYCQVGHGRREIIDAITAQLNSLVVYNTFAPFTNDPAREVSRLIAERSPHPDGRVFLGCSGSEAIDTALKFARLIQQRRGHRTKQIIIRRTHGYHGVNFGGTTAQGIEANRSGWGDLVPHFIEVPHDNIEAMVNVFRDHGSDIAAVLTEPVQGAGGVHVPEDGYLEGARRLCDQHDALLIFDEVICGFGRTGEWFGAQTFGVTPDMMTFAKGVSSGYLPLSGVIISDALNTELSEAGFMIRHGYTYSGHPTACAAGIANINLIESDDLVARAAHIGSELTTGFQALVADGIISSYRGIGAVWAVEIGADALAAKAAMFDRGVIVRGMNETIIFCPPLVITDSEIAQMIEALAEVAETR